MVWLDPTQMFGCLANYQCLLPQTRVEMSRHLIQVWSAETQLETHALWTTIILVQFISQSSINFGCLTKCYPLQNYLNDSRIYLFFPKFPPSGSHIAENQNISKSFFPPQYRAALPEWKIVFSSPKIRVAKYVEMSWNFVFYNVASEYFFRLILHCENTVL